MQIYLFEVLGGSLIGLGLAIPLLVEGRVAGVSGYAADLTFFKGETSQKSLFFICGLILSGVLWVSLKGPWQIFESGGTLKDFFLWGLAGFFVGFGSRLGGGCTSGHGVCGLGRFSKRSFVSVCLFMLVAVITALLISGWDK